jgi:hypothetical protein
MKFNISELKSNYKMMSSLNDEQLSSFKRLKAPGAYCSKARVLIFVAVIAITLAGS